MFWSTQQHLTSKRWTDSESSSVYCTNRSSTAQGSSNCKGRRLSTMVIPPGMLRQCKVYTECVKCRKTLKSTRAVSVTRLPQDLSFPQRLRIVRCFQQRACSTQYGFPARCCPAIRHQRRTCERQQPEWHILLHMNVTAVLFHLEQHIASRLPACKQ